MIGVLLMVASTLFNEASEAIGKQKVTSGEQSLYAMGFLNNLWVSILFLAIIIWKGSFEFSLDSLPTFIPRLILEISLIHITLLTIVKADRSTFGFFRVLTAPLLLVTDLILGYKLTVFQLLGVSTIVLVALFIFLNNKINKAGIWHVLLTAVMAAATLTLYKYDISHFNSVEAEQVIVLWSLLLYFFFASIFLAKENPLAYLKKRVFLAQSFSGSIATAIESFAYLFAPVSVIAAAKRSSSVLWAILSGRTVFKEKEFLFKLISSALLIIGLILLIL